MAQTNGSQSSKAKVCEKLNLEIDSENNLRESCDLLVLKNWIIILIYIDLDQFC